MYGMKRTDRWLTPDKIYKNCCKLWGIKPLLDVAADKDFSKCDNYIDKQKNSLTTEWLVKGKKVPVWCNPPNSLLNEFILRALHQWEKHGMSIIMLVPRQAMSNVPIERKLWRKYKAPNNDKNIIRTYPISPRISFIRFTIPDQHTIDNTIMPAPRQFSSSPQAYETVWFFVGKNILKREAKQKEDDE